MYGPGIEAIFKPASISQPINILIQKQLVLQGFFANFVIFFALHSFPSNQIRGYLLLNYQC